MPCRVQNIQVLKHGGPLQNRQLSLQIQNRAAEGDRHENIISTSTLPLPLEPTWPLPDYP